MESNMIFLKQTVFMENEKMLIRRISGENITNDLNLGSIKAHWLSFCTKMLGHYVHFQFLLPKFIWYYTLLKSEFLTISGLST